MSLALAVVLLLVPLCHAADAKVPFPGENKVRALCSSQSLGYPGSEPPAGQGEEMVVMITDTTFYRLNRTGQSCNSLAVVESRSSLLLGSTLSPLNTTLLMTDVVFASCDLLSNYGSQHTDFTAQLVTKDNRLLVVFATFDSLSNPEGYIIISETQLPPEVPASAVRASATAGSSRTSQDSILATADSLLVTAYDNLTVPLPLAPGKTVEAVSMHVTGGRMSSWGPSFQVLYVRSVSGGEIESFFVSIVDAGKSVWTVTPAYFISRPYSAFREPGGETVWVQSTPQQAWVLRQDASKQERMIVTDFGASDVWLDQRESSYLDLGPNETLAMSERAFGSYSAATRRSKVYTRFSPQSIGSVAVNSAPVASSSVFYPSLNTTVHVVVTAERFGLLLQCSAFDAAQNVEKWQETSTDSGNCVINGCTGFGCCVQQPDTLLNECDTSCNPGYTCLKNHTCV
jgi:hypothetical protein